VGVLGLAGIFVGLLALTAAVLALGMSIASAADGLSYLEWWRNELMALLGLTVKGAPANVGSGFAQAIAIAQGLLRLILPALFVAAIVFRLFVHPAVFVFRRGIALRPTPETFRGELDGDGHVLAIRAYNASRMRALDVRFNVVHQHWFVVAEDTVVRNLPVEIANPRWPMADRHVPYTFFIPLHSNDIPAASGTTELRAIQGTPINPRDRLVVHVSGTMPDLGESFVERQAFELPDSVSDAPYGGVHIEYGSDSRGWPGWSGFDD
jgi:hypothetical protein